jgi:hypothetical protein
MIRGILRSQRCVSQRASTPCGAVVWTLSRWLSQAALEATREVPKTPDGHNPYKVLDLDVNPETTLEEIRDQFKKMAIKYHPDSKGGSNEQMSEVNAAHNIVKQHHTDVIRRLKEQAEATTSRPTQKRNRGRPDRRPRDTKDEELARTGGVASTQKVRDMNQRSWKNTREIEEAWRKLKDDTIDRTAKMMTRFEVAMEQCVYFKQTSLASEVTVKERWLRKNFCKSLWEDIHEMRSELLKRGTRNLQQQELAEEMVAFASATQKKLNEDFSRQAQRQIQSQARIFLERVVKLLSGATATMYFIYYVVSGYWANSFIKLYTPGFLGA